MVYLTETYDVDSQKKEYEETLISLGFEPLTIKCNFDNYKEVISKALPPPDTPDLYISQECDGSEFDG